MPPRDKRCRTIRCRRSLRASSEDGARSTGRWHPLVVGEMVGRCLSDEGYTDSANVYVSP